MLERVQDDISTDDIITEAVLARPDSILTFADGNIPELLDIIAPASVVGIVKQGGLERFELTDEAWVSFEDIFEIALKAG